MYTLGAHVYARSTCIRLELMYTLGAHVYARSTFIRSEHMNAALVAFQVVITLVLDTWGTKNQNVDTLGTLNIKLWTPWGH